MFQWSFDLWTIKLMLFSALFDIKSERFIQEWLKYVLPYFQCVWCKQNKNAYQLKIVMYLNWFIGCTWNVDEKRVKASMLITQCSL